MVTWWLTRWSQSCKKSKDSFIIQIGGVLSELSFIISYTELITKLTARACIKCLPKLEDDFDQEYVRVSKILGGGILDSHVISGLVVARNVEGTIQRYENPKVAVYNAPLDP